MWNSRIKINRYNGEDKVEELSKGYSQDITDIAGRIG
jgi:hypothetical protein